MLLATVAGAAMLFDLYFEKHPEALEELQAENQDTSDDQGTIYLFSQANSYSAKSPGQKTSGRRLFDQAHDKLLQKCHQLRNHQALKAETDVPQKPLFLSYNHLIFRHYYFTLPDEDPLNS